MRIRLLLAVVAAAILCTAPASAQVFQYAAELNGANESPPIVTDGTGTALVTIDMGASTMRVEASFSDLTGNLTVAHIHCCTASPGVGTAGVATPIPSFPGFPSGVTAGSYDMTFDLTNVSSYNASFVTNNGGTAAGAMSALIGGLDSGSAYLNLHSSFATGGEIRGFFQLVPEPSSASLIGVAALGLLGRFRRR